MLIKWIDWIGYDWIECSDQKCIVFVIRTKTKSLLSQIWLRWATDFCHLFDAVFYEYTISPSLFLECFSSCICWDTPSTELFQKPFRHLFHFWSIFVLLTLYVQRYSRLFRCGTPYHMCVWCAMEADLVNVAWIHFAQKMHPRETWCGKIGRLLRQSEHSNFMSVNSNETP